MNHGLIRIRTLALVLAMVALCLPGRAGVIVSNIQLTTTTLSFDIAGTIDKVGPAAGDSLFIGDPLNLVSIFSGIVLIAGYHFVLPLVLG